MSWIALLGVMGTMMTEADSNFINPEVESRVEQKLASMTLDQKIDLIGGDQYAMATRDIQDAGIPHLMMSDGPMGVHSYGKTTAYPAGAGLAATWDVQLAEAFGASIARDARARGVHVWLGPGVNLARFPFCGRNFEYYGEDPLLAGVVASHVIASCQKGGVAATIKHYALNEHEEDRNNDDSIADERTMRELYLKPFEMAVKDAGVWCIMDAYNLVDGVHCTASDWLNNQVLRHDWGFRGVVMSDWGAVHEAKGVILGGCDLEMPWGYYINRNNVHALLNSHEITEKVIDEKVRRILRLGYSMGLFAKQGEDQTIPKDDQKSADVALRMAEEGIVLLKNRDHTLPFKPQAKLALFGSNAHPAIVMGGGSAETEPFAAISVRDALREAAGDEKRVAWLPADQGYAGAAYETTKWAKLTATFFDNMNLSGSPKLIRGEKELNFDWGNRAPADGMPIQHFSARFEGEFIPAETGKYRLFADVDDGLRVWIDDQLVIDAWRDQGVAHYEAIVPLVAGRKHEVRAEYYENEGEAVVRVGFSQHPIEASLKMVDQMLAQADVAIACVGYRSNTEHEGGDRSFELDPADKQLLDKLCAGPKPVVIVLNSGAGADLAPWVDKAAAIIQAWYPGENGNRALAGILYGKINPSGKLPTTFPRAIRGTYMETNFPPKDHKMPYSEGLYMGYRWFDRHGVEPLFPFGFGLSYTTFGFESLKVTEHGDKVTVRVNVKNRGKMAGAEVVQVYAGETKPVVDRPMRELRGFARVELAPGETKEVAIEVSKLELSYWDTAAHRWTFHPGEYKFWVGDSSRDLPAQLALVLK